MKQNSNHDFHCFIFESLNTANVLSNVSSVAVNSSSSRTDFYLFHSPENSFPHHKFVVW